jgi:hypothetical protein
MKFAYSGPFSSLLGLPLRALKPVRDLAGKVLDQQPKYAANSAERYTVETAVGPVVADYLIHLYGRETGADRRTKRRRTRKPVQS